MVEAANVSWIHHKVAQRLFLVCMILSFVSVSSNTPGTFEIIPILQYVTLAIDIVTGTVLTVEAVIRLRTHTFRQVDGSYMKSKKLLFDGLMVMFIWISVFFQVLQMTALSKLSFTNIPVGLIRVPRALILLRVLRYFSFQFESGRLAIIVVRAGHQIGGASLFLLFFLLLYGLLGVQLFGSKSYHCVENGTDPHNVSLSNLAIPDTTCSPSDFSMCPPNFKCIDLLWTLEERGYGAFDNIFVSIKTVYEAASQEGWVFLMYRKIDSFPDWHGYLYFVTLIFFLAWLVKNVFIAIIIEVFAEIRSQLQNLWGNTRGNDLEEVSQVIVSDENSNTWALVDVDSSDAKSGTLEKWRRALRSRWFHLTMLVAIVLNVGISAFQKRVNQLPKNSTRVWNFFSVAELFFTLIFDVEAVMKIICLGFRGYIRRNIYRYEAFLALVTTINTAYPLPALRSFPVLRIIRLVKLSPTLENFVYKIFGPAKKIGLLIAFTVSILTLMSTISLQMLCHVDKLSHFATFPQAFMSMFQIMTQEGWIDVMHETMMQVGQSFIPVSIYFILYHMLATTVMMSLFVAVILDNLELDENLKRLKQLKVSEQSVDTKQPFRLRVFQFFPSKPKMVNLSKIPGDFSLPPLRDTFLRQFVDHRPPVPHSVSAAHSTGLPGPLHTTFSMSSAIVCSTALSTRLAVLDDGLFPSSRLSNGGGSLLPTRPHAADDCRDMTRWKAKSRDEGKSLELLSVAYKAAPVAGPNPNHLNKPKLLESLMRDCSQQRNQPATSPLTGGNYTRSKSILTAQYLIRRERRPFTRKMFSDDKRQADSGINNHQDSLYNGSASQEVDFKQLHLKRQQALLKRQREEQELRENHPLFDTPLFLVKRDSKFRKFCRAIVFAQKGKSDNKGENDLSKQRPMQVLHDLLGLVPYLDWFMIMVTVASCSSMMLETTTNRIHNTPALQVTEYVFVVAMGCELLLKVFANGLLFTPKPTFKDLGGFLDVAIFLVSFTFVCTLSTSTEPASQFLMVLRCLRPLRIFKLVPQIRKVVVELFRGFKEIVMVGILLVALVFVFACFGVQVYGGKLAACNDWRVATRDECHGIFYQQVWISNNLNKEGDEPPGFMVPRVWTNPRNFNFDTIGAAMLALFEVLSLKGWVEVRDILVERMGAL